MKNTFVSLFAKYLSDIRQICKNSAFNIQKPVPIYFSLDKTNQKCYNKTNLKKGKYRNEYQKENSVGNYVCFADLNVGMRGRGRRTGTPSRNLPPNGWTKTPVKTKA